MNAELTKLDPKVLGAAKVLWDYMKLGAILEPVDLIFVLGSRDDRVALWAAELYKQKFSSQIIVSGGEAHQNDLLATGWNENTEAEHFAKIMTTSGIPESSIILETLAQSTGDNVMLGYKQLAKHGIKPHSMLIVTKPYLERRAYATFAKQWPVKVRMIFSSPPIEFESYFDAQQTFDVVINIMVGDLERIIKYPELGYQVAQKVPKKVLDSQQLLINFGYNKRLLQQ